MPADCITSFTASSHVPDGSFPLFSDFRLGRLIGGGIRRAAVATFPKLCNPWPRETTNNIVQWTVVDMLQLKYNMRIEVIISKITIGPTCLPLQNDQIQAIHTGIGLGFQCECTGNKCSRRESSVAHYVFQELHSKEYIWFTYCSSQDSLEGFLVLLLYPSVEVHKCFREVSSEFTTHYIQSVPHLHQID